MKRKTKRKTRKTVRATPTESAPSIVRLANQIAQTETDIGLECTNNVKIQMKLNESNDFLSNMRKVLAGLHREMDKHTAGTRVC